MNKIILKSLLPFWVIITLSSCLSLDEKPLGILGPDAFFTSQEDLNAAVVAVYSRFGNNEPWSGIGHTNFWAVFMGADDTSCPTSNGTTAYDRFSVNDETGAMKSCHWNQGFGIVREANNVINNWEKLGDAPSIRAIAAQAYFLRAWANFMLVRLWNKIPIVLTNSVDYTLSLSPAEDVYKLIISDLEFAIANLPAERGKYVGRPTRTSAQGLIAQVYLMMGGYPINDQTAYAKARDYAKQVIDSRQYRLIDNYWHLWTHTNPRADNNDEVVWSIQFLGFGESGYMYQRSTYCGLNARPDFEGGWSSICFEEGFYLAMPDGARKDATYWTTFEKRAGTPPYAIQETQHYSRSNQKRPFIRKYRDGFIRGENSWSGDSDHMGGRDINYLRYAEILLIYAEAQARVDGSPNDLAYSSLHDVQTRAGTPLTPNGLGRDAFVEAVFHERGWEFAGEFSRWFDLVRTKQLEDYISGSKSYKTENDPAPLQAVTKSSYFMPIPYAEKQVNPNLKESNLPN